MQQQCPKCKTFLNSKNAVSLHMLQDEGCYPSSQDSIADKLEHEISERFGQVEFLMHLIPGTRGSDTLLERWHRVIFQRNMVYDYDTGRFKEKENLTIEQSAHITKQDNLARPKRALIEADKKKHNSDGSIYISHECILPSQQTLLLHDILYQEYKRFWGRRS